MYCHSRNVVIVGGLCLLAMLLSPARAEEFQTLASFEFADARGFNPHGSLLLSGSKLYGTNTYGGVSEKGTIFSVAATGGTPTVLASFSGKNGQHPFGSLTLSGSNLYGVTSGGGVAAGAIFSVPIVGGTLKTLASFDYYTEGAYPQGALTVSGSTLYGMAALGGAHNKGTIFSIPMQGGTLKILASFDGDNGANPRGSLALNGSTLYGTTREGGANNKGTIFRIPTSGGIPTVLADFDGTNGAAPQGDLTIIGPGLYGTTSAGGAHGKGTVFRLPVSGGGVTTLASFDGANGAEPFGGLTKSPDGSTLYGTTRRGGAKNVGTVFSIPVGGGTVKTLVSFDGLRGADPWGSLAVSLDGSMLYGSTRAGGPLHQGAVFSIASRGESLPPLVSKPVIQVPATDWQSDEQRLRLLIRETVKQKPVADKTLPPDVEALLAWSKPVNGLAARIDYVWASSVFFVRLKNVSDQPISVPTGNPSNKESPRWFDAHVQQGTRPLRQVTQAGRHDRYLIEAQPPRTVEDWQRQPTDRPWVTLEPGEDCLALGTVTKEEGSGEPEILKVVLRQPDASLAGRWSGILELPPQPLAWTAKQYQAVRGALPFPSYFPAFSYDYLGFTNGFSESAVENLHEANRPWIDLLKIYDPSGVRKEFERRMRAEKITAMKFLLASPAAAAGSEEAALFFLESAKDTDYFAVRNLHYTLAITYWNYSDGPPEWQSTDPPDWLVDLSLAILGDERQVTGMEKTKFLGGTSFRISSASRETSNLVFFLGEMKCRKAVPLLVDRMKAKRADWHTVHALGAIGDLRAAPVLIEGVKLGHFDEQLYEQAVYALGRLKARDAVPVLLEDIEYRGVIDALGEIGDPRALPALREMVAAGGRIVRNGNPASSERNGERLFAAKLALTQFDRDDGALRLAEMLDDPTWERNQRYDIVLRLGRRPDARVIPHLVKVIKQEPDYYIVNLAIQALADLKDRAAVEGLIECFDADFKAQDLGKGERVTPASQRNHIARSLQRITGQSFGGDKQLWLKWWQTTGKQSPEFK